MPNARAQLITCTSPAEILPYAARLLAEAAEQEGWCVVVPRGHLARELRARTIERFPQAGWAGPRVLTLEQLIAHYQRFIPGGQTLTPLQSRQMIAALVVRAHQRSAGERFRGQVAEGRVSEATLRSLVHLFNELEPHALSPGELRKLLQEGSEAQALSERATEIADVYQAYMESLREQGLQGTLGGAIRASEAASEEAPPEGAERFLFLGLDGSGLRDIGVRLMLALQRNPAVQEVRQLLVLPEAAEEAAWSAHGNDPLLHLWRELRSHRTTLEPGDSLSGRAADLRALALDPSAYRLPPASPSGQVEWVRVPDVQVEAEWIAADIKRRILRGEARPEEIGVVSRDMGSRVGDFERALRRLGVPSVASQEMSAWEVPAVRALLICYRLAAHQWRLSDVIAAAESPYLPLDLNPTLLARIGGSGTTPQSAADWQERIQRLHEQSVAEAAERADLPGDLRARLAEETARLGVAFRSLRETLAEVWGEGATLPAEAWVNSLADLMERWEMENRIYALSHDASRTERAQLVRTDLDALNALLRTAQDWARGREIAGLENTPLDASSWYAELEVIAREAKVRSSTYPQEAVHLCEPLHAALRHWKVTYLAGLVDGIFPAQSEPGAHTLSDAERRALSLPTAEQRSAKERLLFHLVVATAGERLLLTAPAADARGKALVSSAFLTCLPLRISGIRPRDVTARDLVPSQDHEVLCHEDLELLAANRWQSGQAVDEIVSHWLQAPSTQKAIRTWKIEEGRRSVEMQLRNREDLAEVQGREFAGVIRPALLPDRIQAAEAVFSPSELSLFETCHFRYFATRVLGLSQSAEAEEDHDEAAAFGTLQHRILEKLFQGLRQDSLLPPRSEADIEEALSRLDGVARKEVEAHAASAHQRLWHLDLAFVLDVLRLFVHRDLAGMLNAASEEDALRLRTRLVALEVAVGGASRPVEVEREGVRFQLRGTLSRVERIEDSRLPDKAQGKLVLRSYRSTRSERAVKPEHYLSGESFQLPLQSWLAEQHFGERVFSFGELRTSQKSDPPSLDVRRLELDGQGVARLAGSRSPGDNPVAEAQEVALEKATRIVSLMRTGNFAPQPGRSCFGCALKDVCRASLLSDPQRMRERAQMPVAVGQAEVEEARKLAPPLPS